jgi:hypothetical protein
MPKQSESRIILPQRVAQGQAISAIWANQIREAIWRLTMRYGSDQTNPDPKENHPFRILAWYDSAAEKTWIASAFGAFTRNGYGENGAGDWTATSSDLSVRVGSDAGDFIGLTPSSGKIELASGNDYGVWLVARLADFNVSVSGQGVWNFINTTGDPFIIASTAATTPTSAGSISGVSGKFHAWFLAFVGVNSAGIPLVSQYRKSDISHQGAIWFEPEPPEEE